MIIEELKTQVQVVARARLLAHEATENVAESMARWQVDNADITLVKETFQKECQSEEAKLREMTLAIFKETGEKKPLPELGIREVEKLEYDPAEAFKWALEHKVALKLDVGSFEKIAKADKSITGIGFVKAEKVVTATIATNVVLKGELDCMKMDHREERELIQIVNGAEFPIICDGVYHYYYEDLRSHKRQKSPFERCHGEHPDLGS